MGFATLQKLASAAFMDASYTGYLLVTGGFGPAMLSLCAPCQMAITSNLAAVEAFRLAAPDPESAVALAAPFSQLEAVARGLTLAILVLEAWLVGVFVAAPKRRLAHWSLLLFVVSLGILRQEYLFIAVVSLLGLLSAGRQLVWERRAYALAVVVFAAGAIS
jgi:hypothetical protein